MPSRIIPGQPGSSSDAKSSAPQRSTDQELTANKGTSLKKHKENAKTATDFDARVQEEEHTVKHISEELGWAERNGHTLRDGDYMVTNERPPNYPESTQFTISLYGNDDAISKKRVLSKLLFNYRLGPIKDPRIMHMDGMACIVCSWPTTSFT